MARPKQTKAKLFEKTYKGYLADRTLTEYVRIINQIEKEELVIKSKAKHLQVRAVLKRCQQAGIALNYKLLSYSKREDKIKENIIDKIINEKELLNLLNSLPKSPKGDELRLACKLAFYGGLRLSEVLNLKRKDISVNDHLKLNFKGKGGKTRSSFLPLSMTDQMNFFKGFSINVGYITSTLKRIALKLGLNISFHSLRHSFATNMINKGVKLNKVQNLLGHSNIATTSIYLHASHEVDDDMKAIGY